MGEFEWVNEVCPRCDKPVYRGDWATRCRCNGSMLRAEIEALQGAVRSLADWIRDLDPHPSLDPCDYLTDEAEQSAVRRAYSRRTDTNHGSEVRR